MYSIQRSSARFAALGDEVRLELVRFIQTSDRTVNELREYLEISSSLLAHHLQVLEEVDLIERRQSVADGRKKFVVLRHDNLPSLDSNFAMTKVLFVCTENIARSQIASGLWRQLNGGSAQSAGTNPGKEIHPLTLRAAQRHKLKLRDATPRNLPSRIDRETAIITVCDAAFEKLGRDRVQAHWSIPDPVLLGTEHGFDQVVSELRSRIIQLKGNFR